MRRLRSLGWGGVELRGWMVTTLTVTGVGRRGGRRASHPTSTVAHILGR